MSNPKLKSRLVALEAKAEASRESDHLRTDEQIVEWFDRLGRTGYFNGEPDFPIALDTYRSAIEKGHRTPAYEPPHDYQQELSIHERRDNWRGVKSFAAINQGLFWIAEMKSRVDSGKPAVREADFHDLAEWFRENESRLPINECIDIGGERKIGRTNLRLAISKGSRTTGVTELIENLRRLREILG